MTDLMTRAKSGRKAAILLAANVVAGGLIPLLIEWLGKVSFSVSEGTIIALLTTLALTTGEILLKVEEIHELRRGEVALWAMREGIDQLLAKIRTGLHALVADPALRDSFYLDYYSRELGLLDSRIQNTIVRKEILIDRHHIDSTRVLLSIYESPRHNTFRAIAPIGDIADEFDVTFSIYFNAWLDLLRAGKVTSLKRLFVYSNDNELNFVNARKLVAFHNGIIPGLEARITTHKDLHRFKEDYYITDGVDDVGIFSNMYVYLGHTRRGSDISGSFSRDESLIASYTSFFDALWVSRAALPISGFVSETVTEEELFNRSFVIASGSTSNPVTIQP